MPIEYTACRENLGLTEDTIECGRMVSRTQRNGVTITAVSAGPGKARCAAAAQYLISGLGCRLIIDTGSAGSLVDDLAIGDIVFCSTAHEYDLLPAEKFSRHAQEFTGVTVIETILKNDAAAAAFHDFIAGAGEKYGRKITIGACASGEKNVNSRKARETLASAYGCIICDWETAAVVKTANLCGVSCLSIRCVSDMAGENMMKEYRKNAATTLATLYRVTAGLIYDGWLKKLGFDI